MEDLSGQNQNLRTQEPRVVTPANSPNSTQSVVAGSHAYSDTQQVALKAVHSAGLWAIVLGLLNIITIPLMEALIYSPAAAEGHSEAALVLTAFVLGLVIGGIFIALGIKLKRVRAENILSANRTLVYLTIAIAVMAILTLVGGGHGIGLLNLLALFAISEARRKIRKLGD